MTISVTPIHMGENKRGVGGFVGLAWGRFQQTNHSKIAKKGQFGVVFMAEKIVISKPNARSDNRTIVNAWPVLFRAAFDLPARAHL